MTDELHQHAMQRREKTMALIQEAYDRLTDVGWINPNDYPVYLDSYHAGLLRAIEREAAQLVLKHDEAEAQLRAENAARRVV